MIGQTNAIEKCNEKNKQLVNYVMLYDYGDENVGLTGGFGMFHHSNYGSYGVFGNKYNTYMNIGANTSNPNPHKNVYSEKTIDVSEYAGFSVCHFSSNTTKFRAGFSTIKPDNNNNIWVPHDAVKEQTVATTGDVIGTNAKVLTNTNMSLNDSYYFVFTCYRNSGSTFYSDVYACLMYKEDDFRTLASIADITTGTIVNVSINDILLQSSKLLSNEEAVKFMLSKCTGSFMVKAVTNSTFLTALNESPYKTLVWANEHWVKFLNMVA